MFHPRHHQTLFILLMSLLMSLALSLVFLVLDGSAAHAGSIGAVLALWLTRFARTWLVVLPAVLLISPLAKRIAGMLVRPEGSRGAHHAR